MSVLALAADHAGVRAAVVGADGALLATARSRLPAGPGPAGAPAEQYWRAGVTAAQDVLAEVDRASVTALGMAEPRASLLVWDTETLGSPRPALVAGGGAGDGADGGWSGRLRVLAEEEPHTWALVEDGRYAVGTLGSYLLARASRGTFQVTDVATAARTGLLDPATGSWDRAACERLGLPADALSEVVASWGPAATTDPRSFLGLALPVTGLAGHLAATLVGRGCARPGPAARTGHGLATLVGPEVPGAEPAWRSPAGVTTYAVEVAAGPLPVAVTGIRAHRPESAARGAAYLAGLGTGLWSAVEDLPHPPG